MTFPTSVLRRMALAGALTVGVGGTATSAIPGMEHWPPSAVAIIVAVTAFAGLLRKVLTVVLVAVGLTIAALLLDAATGGSVQDLLSGWISR
ncbi:Uncharacterised protein (plasmid) [Tsukamurella tyrosinosolvens]|uniref:Uncharacterized protein n=1 Tax=Tsukamurella tyrosinosolvens TaxID=57704 RepID=A0A1H4UGP8_TSUTY|nr:hypothetical protein [Tsukamurella tyrosinosolvens]KXO92925.1 hypothetical protein AXK58_13720 [Tsukamurella tyrosinosolvens]SEC67813.1 hypothetical protein SAMN04489793_2894 [Tsukamurella tyrosinosolvens]VEH94209.1 Uncharacterised protein [Tsukamurella tyrosinosolvens]